MARVRPFAQRGDGSRHLNARREGARRLGLVLVYDDQRIEEVDAAVARGAEDDRTPDPQFDEADAAQDLACGPVDIGGEGPKRGAFAGDAGHDPPRTVGGGRVVMGARGGDWEILSASAFVSIAVPLGVFFAMQKYLVRGLLAGSVK